MADTAGTSDNSENAKKSTTKKTTAGKSAAKKSAPRKAAAKTSAPRKAAAATSAAGKAPAGVQLAYVGAEQLVQLTQKPFEGVVGLDRVDDGWAVQVEVLELRRIPETTDVIGVYEVRLDPSGELVGYKRLHRYVRGEAGEDR